MPEVPQAKGAASRRGLGLLIRVLLTALALGWLMTVVDPLRALERIGEAPTYVLVVPSLLLLCNSLLHALRMRVLLGGAGLKPPLLRLYAAFLKAAFFGLVLPSGGAEVAKVGFLRAELGRADLPLAALLIARLLELVPWTLLLIWGLVWGLREKDPLLGNTALLFVGIFLCVLVLAVLAVRRGARLAGLLPGRVGRFAVDVALAFEQIREPRRILLAGLLAFPFALVNGLVVYVLTRAYGLDLAYTDVLALIPAADAVISLPITVSGLGLREGMFVHLLAPYGANEATAVAIGVLRWSGELGRAAVGGVLFLLQGGRRSVRS